MPTPTLSWFGCELLQKLGELLPSDSHRLAGSPQEYGFLLRTLIPWATEQRMGILHRITAGLSINESFRGLGSSSDLALGMHEKLLGPRKPTEAIALRPNTYSG
jgi:hypothetical protein